jgi:hypothetical protein
MDEVMKESKHKVKQFQVGYWKLQQIKISEQAYADDVVLIAAKERNLNYNLKIWNESLKNRGLKINTDKTKTMVIAKNAKKHNIKVGKQQTEQVETFKYLGAQINQEGRINEEINTRIASSSKLFNSIKSGFLNHKEIIDKTKLSVYKFTFSTILSFASETWVLNKKHKSNIQTMEMRSLRKGCR